MSRYLSVCLYVSGLIAFCSDSVADTKFFGLGCIIPLSTDMAGLMLQLENNKFDVQ